jgi:hypothetical protein
VAAGGLEPAFGGAHGLLRLLVDEVEEPRRGELVRLVDRRRRRPRVGRHGWMGNRRVDAESPPRACGVGDQTLGLSLSVSPRLSGGETRVKKKGKRRRLGGIGSLGGGEMNVGAGGDRGRGLQRSGGLNTVPKGQGFSEGLPWWVGRVHAPGAQRLFSR